ncbi:MAG TPA: two-component regulator propeller domain-containing protein [Cyclobacteriaceae bacterium]|nr:two-component regulator propeller domain-containing protein [Cyclobacteriaceae bacterium]
MYGCVAWKSERDRLIWKVIQVTLISIYVLFISQSALAQNDIPIGTWRMHLSYNTINSITFSNDKIYGAAESGIVVLDRDDNSISSYSKINGLTGSSISFINYDNVTSQLLAGYEDGNLDIIKENTITNFDRLTDPTIPGSKQINHITFRDGTAYLSCDYGVVVFNMFQREVQETWRDLGPGGELISIKQSAIKGDSIFLATSMGVLAGDLDDNLLDFNNWKRFDKNEFNGPIHSVVFFNNTIYATIDNEGLYYYENGLWTKESFLTNITFQSLTSSSENLLICEGNKIWKLSAANSLISITSSLITTPKFALQDDQQKIWIGDLSNGMVSDRTGSFASYIPNGPAFIAATRLKFIDNRLYALRGGYAVNFQPKGNAGVLSTFASGLWSTEPSPAQDLTDVDVIGGTLFTSSYGYGVLSGDISSPDIIYNETNSSLVNLNPGMNGVYVPALEHSADNLWVCNYGAASPLHLFSNNSWQSFNFGFTTARYPLDLLIDYAEGVWIMLNPSQGGGVLVFNQKENKTSYLTNQTGSGGLPSKNVYAFARDRDGYIWIGTDKGVAYFTNPTQVFSSGVNAVWPIFENRYLLTDEKITAIAVDGGNRKWIGTERGVWLFNPTGEEQVYSFNVTNSPLPSNVILSIAADPTSGEVFFSTDKGMVSFRSDATDSQFSFQSVKVFPNPVTPEFNGTVGISGLATDAIVKITDVSGKLIWQTQANGGTATWNVRDYNGRRASTGMYLIFSATPDGGESFVGKIAVIE